MEFVANRPLGTDDSYHKHLRWAFAAARHDDVTPPGGYAVNVSLPDSRVKVSGKAKAALAAHVAKKG